MKLEIERTIRLQTGEPADGQIMDEQIVFRFERWMLCDVEGRIEVRMRREPLLCADCEIMAQRVACRAVVVANRKVIAGSK